MIPKNRFYGSECGRTHIVRPPDLAGSRYFPEGRTRQVIVNIDDSASNTRWP
jgi:hypothetical protein